MSQDCVHCHALLCYMSRSVTRPILFLPITNICKCLSSNSLSLVSWPLASLSQESANVLSYLRLESQRFIIIARLYIHTLLFVYVFSNVCLYKTSQLTSHTGDHYRPELWLRLIFTHTRYIRHSCQIAPDPCDPNNLKYSPQTQARPDNTDYLQALTLPRSRIC